MKRTGINQFFGQIGGEEKAGTAPLTHTNAIGPGLALKTNFGDKAQVVGTVICGDNYFAENPEQATREIIDLIRTYDPHLVVAGPAFNAGRYGPACAAVCKAMEKELKIPAITGMFPENPGWELNRGQFLCVETGPSASGMRQAMEKIADLGLRLASGLEIGPPDQEGYLPKGIRKNYRTDEIGAVRAVNMLLRKIRGETFVTELPMPDFDRVQPADPLTDLQSATIALVTEGGIVPKGNPDRLESARATKYLVYSVAEKDDLTGTEFQSVHGGYSNVFANEDPDRVVPLDALRSLEREGKIGKVYPRFFTTTGNGTSLENGRAFGKEIADLLLKDSVDGAILTST